MDNLYPTAPRGPKRRNELFNRFAQEMNSPHILNEDRPLERIARESIEPTAMMPQQTKPMDVVFDQGNISETARAMNAARSIHGIDLGRNALSPYQAGQLQNRGRELDIREQNVDLGQQRVNETAEMGEFKRKNPGVQFVKQPDGNILAVGPGGQTLGNFGPSGIMGEERKLGVQQQNAVQLADRQGEIRGALEDKSQYGRTALQGQRDLGAMARTQVTAGNKPIGTTRDVGYTYGPGGEITGAKSTTKQVMPPQQSKNSAMMYGPNGEGPYPIPIDQTDAAQEKYGMTFSPAKKK